VKCTLTWGFAAHASRVSSHHFASFLKLLRDRRGTGKHDSIITHRGKGGLAARDTY
jgi:hypothetical protein